MKNNVESLKTIKIQHLSENTIFVNYYCHNNAHLNIKNIVLLHDMM